MTAIRVIQCMACSAPSFQDVIVCKYCGMPLRFEYMHQACRALCNSGEPMDTLAVIDGKYTYFEKEKMNIMEE